ncbi:MAG: hypothetical protein V1891_04510 [bacterium]
MLNNKKFNLRDFNFRFWREWLNLSQDAAVYIVVIGIALIAGLSYFIIQINSIPKLRFIPYNLNYTPRK